MISKEESLDALLTYGGFQWSINLIPQVTRISFINFTECVVQ